ncbi:MAG: type I polyketide synthase, partial [Pyrinomonadaceae bacterium]
MSNADSSEHLGQIAVIGMAVRFPGARNVAEFWRNLRDGVESVTFFSEEELAAEGIPPYLINNPRYVKANAVLPDVEMFDAGFFGINTREAQVTDPQHRFFLECAWEALEDAGYDSATYGGRIGVYASESVNTYFLLNLGTNHELLQSMGSVQMALGNDRDFLATRASFLFNLKGPSIVVQSACSSSLVAAHLACQSLNYGECDMALVGGVSISHPQKAGYMYQEGGIYSPDGHCRAFDAEASGTVGGNGVGLVVLKRLDDAIADGDSIHAVIKGSAINNDGSVKVGYTAPSIDGQAKVITEAIAMAGVSPESIRYVETHGTGTPLGDPVEISALTQAFRASTEKKGFCAVGSVKTNFGHLDAAAGVAGLVKTVLSLKHKQLPPSLNYERPNPAIDFANSPFYVNRSLSPLTPSTAQPAPFRAGVSSFGIGGTNAHLVLEEAPPQPTSDSRRQHHLLLLSARTSSALEAATLELREFLQAHPESELADVAYTLQVGRRGFAHRRMVLCESVEEAVNGLEKGDGRRVLSGQAGSGERAVVMMFSGQGTEYVNMGRELYEGEERFRAVVDRCAESLLPHLGLDLRTILYPAAGLESEAEAQLHEMWLAQPALFVTEYALAQQWMEWGVRPEALIGHSLGEYVAASVAGVMELE